MTWLAGHPACTFWQDFSVFQSSRLSLTTADTRRSSDASFGNREATRGPHHGSCDMSGGGAYRPRMSNPGVIGGTFTMRRLGAKSDILVPSSGIALRVDNALSVTS